MNDRQRTKLPSVPPTSNELGLNSHLNICIVLLRSMMGILAKSLKILKIGPCSTFLKFNFDGIWVVLVRVQILSFLSRGTGKWNCLNWISSTSL